MRQYTDEQVRLLEGRALDNYSDELEQALASCESTESIVRRFALIPTPNLIACDYMVSRWGWAIEITPTGRYMYY